jgi:hypothetical protein
MLNFVILLLTKHDISTTEKSKKGRELKTKQTMNRELRRRKRRRNRKTENDTEFLGFNVFVVNA